VTTVECERGRKNERREGGKGEEGERRVLVAVEDGGTAIGILSGEGEERLEDGVLVRVAVVVEDDVDCRRRVGEDGEREKGREGGRTEVELVKDLFDECRRLRSSLAVKLRPLAPELVRLILPRLERRRVNDGRLDHLSAGEDAPGDGVRTGNGVRAEVALLVDGVVGDGRGVIKNFEQLVDMLGRAEELDVGLREE
jgi:hypothetical protein